MKVKPKTLGVVLSFGLVWLLATPARAGTFIVTNPNDSGPGSLRQAIVDSNAAAGGMNAILSTLPAPSTITLASPLPAITAAVLVDGTSLLAINGGPSLEVDGSQITGDGFVLNVAGCTLRGLVINSFAQGAAIRNVSFGAATISGNYIGIDITGTAQKGNLAGVVDGTVISGNVISGNKDGIVIDKFLDPQQITGNFIGTDVTGSKAIGNQNGVRVSNFAQIGGPDPTARNVISGNGVGLLVEGSAVVTGNFIGTDSKGLFALPNGTGISAGSASWSGGLTATGNLISGNLRWGIFANGLTFGSIQNNLIGTDITGKKTLGNGCSGIFAKNSFADVFNITDNVIAGNGEDGILLRDNQLANLGIDGNYIGTDSTQKVAMGNLFAGIRTSQGSPEIGAPQAGNIIANNGGPGILVESGGPSVFPVSIANNSIFENGAGILVVDGSASIANNLITNNHLSGIDVEGQLAASSATIQSNSIASNQAGITVTNGATASITSNLISSNLGIGVDVVNASKALIEANSIEFNMALGIDIGGDGVTLAGLPVLTSAAYANGSTSLVGSVRTSAQSTVHLEFFENAVCDTSGYGQGQALLGTQDLATDANGNATFSLGFGSINSTGAYITATATISGSTSEFSRCRIVGDYPLTNVTGVNLQLHDNQPFSGTVASFADADPLSLPSQFSATINWGDGSSATAATLVAQGAGNYNITGTHTYATQGTYPLKASIMDIEGTSASTSSTATVTDFSLTSVAGRSLRFRLGQPFTLVVATFSDPDPVSTASQFAGTTINWGDGSPPAPATIVGLGDGNYEVVGSHTYQILGGWMITTTIRDAGGGIATATSFARMWPRASSN